MKKYARLSFAVALLVAGSAWAGKESGNCQSMAVNVSMGSTTSVTLVNEWYPDTDDNGRELATGDYTDMGVYWYKITLSRYTSCSIWIDNASSKDLWLDVGPNWMDENAPSAWFDTGDLPDGTHWAVMESDSWYEDDPASAVYYICISGEIGDTATLHIESGVREFKLSGTYDNPVSLSVSDKWGSASGSLWDGYYYYSTKLQVGNTYQFYTTGGTRSFPRSLSVTSDSVEWEEMEDAEFKTDYNDAWIIAPKETGWFTIELSGEDNYSMKYRRQPGLPIESHDAQELCADESGTYSMSFTPGRMRSSKMYFDNIIDERLYHFSLQDGQRCIFETSGADTNILLMVYNSVGDVIASSTGLGDSFDAFAAITAVGKGSSTNYYVGVCNPNLDVDATGWEGNTSITLTGTIVEAADGTPDEWDALDDASAGATELLPAILRSGDQPPSSVVHGPHALSRADWVDTFVISTTKGCDYGFYAAWGEGEVDEEAPFYNLAGEVYTLDSKGNEKVVASSDSLVDDPIEFYASTGGKYYLRTFVAESMGLPSYPYNLYAAAVVSDTNRWGYLNVSAKGAASATWKLNKDTTLYPCGGTWVVPVGTNTVTYSEIKGFTTPAAQKVEVLPAGTAEAVGVYNDTYDPKDDTEGNAMKLSPAAKVATTTQRTLFVEDAEDNFTFEAKEGYFYNFEFSYLEADAVFEIKNAAGERVTDGLVTELRRASFPTGKYILKVRHAGETSEEWTDAAYTLSYSCVNVGAVKFSKTAISVKENAAYAELTIKRTSKEGAVRVRYCTVADTAQPQTDYYPVSGEVSWASGSNSDKKIRVRLVPDEYPTWEGNKTFKVELKPVEMENLVEDEYLAQITTPAAVVTMTEVSKAAPGTIAVTAGAVDDAEMAFSAKKPAFTVTAGETLSLTISRTDGGNGKVGVRVQTVKGTATDASDYEAVDEELVWEDGETDDKTVAIATIPQEDQYKDAKAFTVKLTALSGKGYDGFTKAKVAAASVGVTVRNNLIATTGEAFAKSITDAGLSVKVAKSDMWYVDSDLGDLVTVPCAKGAKAELTFTLNGPGLFAADPMFAEGDGDGTSSFTCTVGKESAVDCKGGDEIVRLVPSGSTTVKFTLVSQTAGAVAGLANCNGTPYVWIPLGSAKASPADKACVLPQAADEMALAWNVPATAQDYGIRYRVLLGADKKLKGATQSDPLETPAIVWPEALAPGKTWYWRVDYGLPTEGGETQWVAGKSVWTFSTTAAGAAQASVPAGQKDAVGADVVAGEPATLMQGVKASVALASDADGASFSVLTGKLPDGLKLAQDKTTKEWTVSGVPTKAGSYSALVQAKGGKIAGTTVALAFNVLPTKLAAGTFEGLFMPVGDGPTNRCARIARVALTATEAGKLSAKVQIAGKSYSFAATGFDAVSDYDAELGRAVYSATLTQVQKVGKTATYTNTLDIVVENAALDDLEVLGRAPEVSRLVMAALPDAKGSGAQNDLVYEGELLRDNSKVSDCLNALDDFVGYYTVALCPPSGTSAIDNGVPSGNGYLTLTLDAKGKAKVAGALADGTSVSFSSTVYLLGNLANEEDAEDNGILVPIYVAKGQYVLGGYLRLGWEEGDDGILVQVADSTRLLVWLNDDPASTYSGAEGFELPVTPVGGWYDKVVNLQAHYLSSAFTLGISDELPPELLAAGYEFATGGLPSNLGITVTGNELSVDKKSLVKEEGSKSRYDLFESVNPWDMKLTFKRATGILTGSFSVWSDDSAKQKEITGFKHAGVLLLSRSGDVDDVLPGTAWTAGYCLTPGIKLTVGSKSRTWKASLPFNIVESVGEVVFDGIDNWGE